MDEKKISKGITRDAEELYDLISELSRLYSYRNRDAKACIDVTLTERFALRMIIKYGPLTIVNLAMRLQLDKSTTSRAVDSLVLKRYISRSVNKNDLRSVVLKATTSGNNLWMKLFNQEASYMAKLIKGFDSRERKATKKFVKDLLESLSMELLNKGR